MLRSTLCVAGLLVASTCQGGIGAWTTQGPEGVQGQSLATSPADPNVVLLVGSGAIFKSTNSGVSWTNVGNGLSNSYPTLVWMHPTLINRYLALSYSRLHRTVNGGTSWTTFGAGLPAASTASFVDIKVDPSDPNRMLIVDSLAGVFRSVDGGANWTASSVAGLGASPSYTSVTYDPNLSSRVMLKACDSTATSPAFFRSTDGGATFVTTTIAGVSPGCTNGGFAFSTTSAGTAVTDAYGQLYRSTDSGANWAVVATPLPGSASFGQNAGDILQYRNGANELYLLAPNGLFLSSDNGTSWASFGTGLSNNGTDNAGIVDIDVLPGSSPLVRYALSSAGSFFKSGVGTTAFVASNTGLVGSNIRAALVHPANANVLLAGWGDVGLSTSPAMFRSTDRGLNWTRPSGLFLDEIRALAFDPNTTATVAGTTVYASGWDAAPVGQPAANFHSSIAKSTDGGLTWTALDNFTPALTNRSLLGRARAIAFDRTSGSGAGGTGPLQTFYFTARGRVLCPTTGAGTVAQTLTVPRLWKTTNAGAMFNSVDSLPTGTCIPTGAFTESRAYPIPVPMVIDPSNPLVLYVGTYLSSGYNATTVPAEPIPTVSNGIFKSSDGGVSWALSATGLPRVVPGDPTSSFRDVLALAIDPVSPNILYAASNPTSGSAPGRVYKSVNGGATWTNSSTGISGQDIRALLIDPLNHNKIYAASGGNGSGPGGVYFSSDAGVTWSSTSISLPSSSATSLALDNSGADPILYAGSRAGLYDITQVPDLDLDGPSNSLEASAPFGGDGNQDGIPDAQQSNVASINLAGANRAINAAQITLSVTPIVGACNSINDASADAAEKIAPVEADTFYPFGTVRLEILNCSKAIISVRFHGQIFDARYKFRNFGPDVVGNPATLGWRETANAGFTGNTWTFLFDDNTPGDNRDELNRILFIGGPAFFDDTLLKNGFE
jgi:hypothetical protein